MYSSYIPKQLQNYNSSPEDLEKKIKFAPRGHDNNYYCLIEVPGTSGVKVQGDPALLFSH